jgi:hypothetical protein
VTSGEPASHNTLVCHSHVGPAIPQ